MTKHDIDIILILTLTSPPPRGGRAARNGRLQRQSQQKTTVCNVISGGAVGPTA